MVDPVKARLLDVIRAHRLFEPGQRVLIAMSGGLDSMVLGELLWRTRGVHRAQLAVAHVDHGQHPASATWQTQVVAWAEARALPVHLHRASLPAGASEAACREARYAWWDALPVDHVALAHHADDQAETVLIRLLRGTGPDGLRGMAWRRGRYIRPLLGERRAALRSWAESDGIHWSEDPANAAPRFLRSRVRAELIPLLEAIRPGSTEAIARTAVQLAEDAAVLDELAAGLPLTSEALRAAPRALARRRLRQLLPHAPTPIVDAALAVVARGQGRVQLPGGGVLVVGPAASGVWVEGASLGFQRPSPRER